MLHNTPLKSQNEQFGSTRWHALKDKYKYLFGSEHVPLIEDWYNKVAAARYRENFRDIAKAIHHSDAGTAIDTSTIQAAHQVPLEVHRAAHMTRLYGPVFSAEGRARARTWLLTADAKDVDKFRDVFTALSKILGVQTTTKEAFVERPVAVPVPKDRNRRKIDWNSEKAQEAMKKVENPMAGQKLPMLGKRTSSSAPAAKRTSQTEFTPEFDKQCDDTFEALRDKQRANTLEGVYSVKDGCTIYQPKARVGGVDQTKERIVATFDNPSAANWKSTTRDHIRNHGFVKHEVVNADQHPAIARVTASLGLCVPTLKPKNSGPLSIPFQ